MRCCIAAWFVVVAAGVAGPSVGFALDELEDPPIAYSSTTPQNRVSRLQERLNRHEIDLSFDRDYGYLKSVLNALDIPVESQALVFSKTSLQVRKISPRTPRAIYFSDDVYVGFCQSGDVLEVSAVDPRLGTAFYILDQRAAATTPTFERRIDNCLICHSSAKTGSVPGHLVRSLYVGEGGYPVQSVVSGIVDHTTPLELRWGGWYVTARRGPARHPGNLVVEDGASPFEYSRLPTQNLDSLADRFDTSRYLTPHSDIVALMVLEHQVLVHNRITRASFTTRQALADEALENFDRGMPETTQLPETTRRIEAVGEELLRALLLVDEAPLSTPLAGTSNFAQVFAARGPQDSSGRSLRDLDLERRLFKYPCSFLIDSEAFRGLPSEVSQYVWERLGNVLSGQDQSQDFAHLSVGDRRAIIDILRETIPDLPTTIRRP